VANDKKLHDNISRVKAPSPVGKSIFVGLRLADALWQFSFLNRGWASQLVSRLNDTPLPVTAALNGQLRPYYQILVTMALGSGIKQAIHMAFISEQELSAGLGFGIGFFNMVFNSTNILFGIWSATSQAPVSEEWLSVLSKVSLVGGT
jgi:hypothetical protein